MDDVSYKASPEHGLQGVADLKPMQQFRHPFVDSLGGVVILVPVLNCIAIFAGCVHYCAAS
jgi:hypothetical protein